MELASPWLLVTAEPQWELPFFFFFFFLFFPFFFFFFFFFCFFSLCYFFYSLFFGLFAFSRLLLRHIEVPRLGVQSEL